MYPINLTKRLLAFMYAVSRHNDPELFVTFLQPNIKKSSAANKNQIKY